MSHRVLNFATPNPAASGDARLDVFFLVRGGSKRERFGDYFFPAKARGTLPAQLSVDVSNMFCGWKIIALICNLTARVLFVNSHASDLLISNA
jgi:hypothetical protein